jgi:ferredoxin-type protein NapH
MNRQRQRVRRGMILIAFFLFPAVFYYLSPMLIIEASSKGIINGSFILFLLLFLSTLFLGRAYCGWVCPGAGCQESISLARTHPVTRGFYVKWFIWLPWIGTIIASGVRAGGYGKVDFFYQTTHGLSVADTHSLLNYFAVLFLLIVLPAFAVGKRSFCHHLCWMAPFMILGRSIRNRCRWSSLQLKPKGELCTQCGACSKQCPMSLPVHTMVKQGLMENAECILCGACVDVCSRGAIAYDWGRFSARKRSRSEMAELQSNHVCLGAMKNQIT